MPQRFDAQGFINAWNTQQTDRILEFYADDAELIVLPDPEPYRGKDGIRQNLTEVFRGFDDLNGDLVSVVQEGNKVAALVEVSGKHTGDMTVSEDRVIPATNRDVRFKLGVFVDLDDAGKIRRELDVVDNLTLLEAVGAMPGAEGAARSETPGRKR